jgi:hypothetical protein
MVALATNEVEKLLGDLLGVAVTVRPGGAPTGAEGLAGHYVDNDGHPKAGVWLDRSLAACAGASLAMIPKGSAQEAIANGSLPDNLVENAGEVLNVLGTLLRPDASVKLAGVTQTPPGPDALAPLLSGPTDQSWFTIAVAGYGAGVAFVVRTRGD